VPPGEVPEIEPGASMLQKLGVAALNIVKALGEAAGNADVIIVVRPEGCNPMNPDACGG
jgi:hypothetical protein